MHDMARSPWSFKVQVTSLRICEEKCLLPLIVHQIVPFVKHTGFSELNVADICSPMHHCHSILILGIADLLTDQLFTNRAAPNTTENVMATETTFHCIHSILGLLGIVSHMGYMVMSYLFCCDCQVKICQTVYNAISGHFGKFNGCQHFLVCSSICNVNLCPLGTNMWEHYII